jgi:CPA2 family monovalent cation:H+ antiporter-2
VGAWHLLFEIVLLLGSSLLLGAAARKLGQRPVVGYLIAGIILGPRSLGAVQSIQTVEFLAELGVALLLFTIGLELSWQKMAALGRSAVVGGALQMTFCGAGGIATALMFGMGAGTAFVIGAVVALSSTALVLQLLADRAEIDSQHGRASLGILLFQDLAIVPLLVLLSIVAQGKQGPEGVIELGASFGRAILLVGALYVVIRIILPRAVQAAGGGSERDFPIVLAVFVCLGCSLAAHEAGLSPVLGAFAAGVMLADQPAADQIRADVIPLRSVFVMLFFTSIGMLATVPKREDLPAVLLLAMGLALGKSLLTLVALKLQGQPLSTAAQTGIALAQIGEFSFVLVQDATRKGLLPSSVSEPLIAASVLSLLATPYLIALAARVGPWLGSRTDLRIAEPSLQPTAIIVGMGPAGRRVVEALRAETVPILVLETNPATVRAFSDQFPIRLGDARSADILEHAGIRQAKALVVTTPDPAASRIIVSQVRAIAPGIRVICRARYHIYAEPLRLSGATLVVDEEDVVGERLAAATLECMGLRSQHVVEPAS